MAGYARRIPIDEQLQAVEAAELDAERALELAKAEHDGREIGRLEAQLEGLAAAIVTMRWLARDREGCIQLLTTKIGAS